MNTDLLHIKDPVVLGIPSLLEVEAQWNELSGNLDRVRDQDNSAVVLEIRLHKGDGFPSDIALQQKGLRWRLTVEGNSVTSKKGSVPYVDDGGPQTSIPQNLLYVVEKLYERNVPLSEIADITNLDVQQISEWIHIRQVYIEKQQAAQTQLEDPEHRVPLQWNQVFTMLSSKPHTSSVLLELMDEKRVVGQIPIRLKALFSQPKHSHGVIRRHPYPLQAPRQPEASLANWFLPMCQNPVDPRFFKVTMEVTLKMRALELGAGPPRPHSAPNGKVTFLRPPCPVPWLLLRPRRTWGLAVPCRVRRHRHHRRRPSVGSR